MKQGKTSSIKSAITLCCLAISSAASAQGAPKPSELNNPLAIVLLIVAAALMLAIVMLAPALIGAAQVYMEKRREEAANATPVKTLLVIGLCFTSSIVFAQDGANATAAQTVSTTISGLSKFSFYTLMSVITLEIIVLLTMLHYLKLLITKDKVVVAVEHKLARIPVWKTWWEKINSFRPEHQVGDTGHNYDGIRELDNKLPPWWLYGFYGCIVFAIVYLYRYEVVHSAPSSKQEYEIAMVKAEEDKLEYLKNAANNVDENTVTLIADADALDEGKKIFLSTCAACHGPEGQGTVGPNLTDDYWLHKGSVQDVFKTIKYGIPEKGMKSWKDDFSPVQIAKLTSYIKSIRGTKPINPKEPQGEIFTGESPAPPDSLKTGTDKKFAFNNP